MPDEGSPDLYQKRKHAKLEVQEPRPTFATNSLSTHRRPHRTLPELREERPNVWLPPPPPPVPPNMVWDTGVAWDSGWKWL